MKYKGQEIAEFKPTEAVFFNPPKRMLVWDYEYSKLVEADVIAVLPNRYNPVIGTKLTWRHCAEIPEQKLATYRELARWLAEGKGEMQKGNMSRVFTSLSYASALGNDPIDYPINEFTLVRKWDDTEWVFPTREYLGLED
jgi:hypothetical protein